MYLLNIVEWAKDNLMWKLYQVIINHKQIIHAGMMRRKIGPDGIQEKNTS